jgi:hypothetical protein
MLAGSLQPGVVFHKSMHRLLWDGNRYGFGTRYVAMLPDPPPSRGLVRIALALRSLGVVSAGEFEAHYSDAKLGSACRLKDAGTIG